MMNNELLQLAVDDNTEWCTAICESHQADIHLSKSIWINCQPSPRYYPNIITRAPQAQAATLKAINRLQKLNPNRSFGIKDSFGDIDLTPQGFRCVLCGRWYGGYFSNNKQTTINDWQAVQSTDELALWEIAWGGNIENRIFKDSLLSDTRIKFWFVKENKNIHRGFISFHSEKCIGISNWFSNKNSVFELSISEDSAPIFRDLPVVFWQADNEAINAGTAISPLGSMRVWLAPET